MIMAAKHIAIPIIVSLSTPIPENMPNNVTNPNAIPMVAAWLADNLFFMMQRYWLYL